MVSLKTLWFSLFLFIGFNCILWAQDLPPVSGNNRNGIAFSYRETLNHYCVTCHNQTLKTAGLMLDVLDTSQFGNDARIWEKVLRKLRTRQMPPAGMPRPNENVYIDLIAQLENGLDSIAAADPNPGRPALHRLNRAEYSNAVRDLLGLEINSTDLLPADDIGYGFDNIGDVLTVSPLLLERYLSAAAKISRLAIGDMTQPPDFQTYNVSRNLNQEARMGNDLPYGSRGGVSIRHYFPVNGEYLFNISLQIGRFDEILGRDKERRLDIRLDGKRLQRFIIAADERGDAAISGEEPAVASHLEVRVPVQAGTHTLVATFLKDTTKPEGILERTGASTRALLSQGQAFFEGVGSVSIGGPYNITGLGVTPSRKKVFICRPSFGQPKAECARKIITSLARVAYRRPIVAEDLPTLLSLYEEGESIGGFETGIRMALQKILVSPEFLFRMEFEPADVKPGEAYAISDLELASRLSFFLWSSIPDEELLKIAERGQLKSPGMLQQQIDRMLADSRSQALVKNFAGQWLFLRNIARVQPDPIAFPNFDENLRQSLRQETELLIESMMREDRSVVDLLDSDYTFLNERLAEHYGIGGVYGAEFRRVSITDPRRRGLLGQGSILTVTSYPNRTAPTIRGKWVLEQLLGTPPPPPPPNVPSLKDDNRTKVLTMRERMEMHRANPACAVCHKVMDPLGFALENFDGVGRWRDTIGAGNGPIDVSGVLPNGTEFNGPVGLRDILVSQHEQFVETFIERLLTYALGRGVEYYDFPAIRKIRRDAADNDYKWSAIISGIVNSVPFQMRKASQP